MPNVQMQTTTEEIALIVTAVQRMEKQSRAVLDHAMADEDDQRRARRELFLIDNILGREDARYPNG